MSEALWERVGGGMGGRRGLEEGVKWRGMKGDREVGGGWNGPGRRGGSGSDPEDAGGCSQPTGRSWPAVSKPPPYLSAGYRQSREHQQQADQRCNALAIFVG